MFEALGVGEHVDLDDPAAADREGHDREPAGHLGHDDPPGAPLTSTWALRVGESRANVSACSATAAGAADEPEAAGGARRRRRAARRRGRAPRAAPSKSPSRAAARNASTTSRWRPGRRRGRGRVPGPGAGPGWRAAGWPPADRPTTAAISSNGTANMSCSTNASRSAGASVSSTTSRARPTESASSACVPRGRAGPAADDGVRQAGRRASSSRRAARRGACPGRPGDDRGQPAAQVLDRAGVGPAEPEPGLLDGVLRLAQRPEHPVGHRPQVRPVRLEPLRPARRTAYTVTFLRSASSKQ